MNLMYLENEFIKLKNSRLWLVLLLTSFIIPVGVSLIWYFKVAPTSKLTVDAQCLEFYSGLYNFLGFFLQVICIYIPAAIFQIENKANSWKQIFIQPANTNNHYFLKILISLILLVIFILMINSFIFIFGGILFHTVLTIPFTTIILLNTCIIITAFSIVIIHTFLNIIIKNNLLSIIIGFSGIIISMMLKPGKYTYFWPYSAVRLIIYSDWGKGYLSTPAIYGLINAIIFSVVFFILGMLFFKKVLR